MIGAAIAKTGYLAPYDATFAAVEQLVKETNAKGGIDGHKIGSSTPTPARNPSRRCWRSRK